jgi:hypothetical protein
VITKICRPLFLDGVQQQQVNYYSYINLYSLTNDSYIELLGGKKGGSISKVLLKANVTVLPNAVCINQYSSNEFFGNTMLCAAAPGKDTCQVC